MSLEEKCDKSSNVVMGLLQKYFDPVEDFATSEYLELARNLLELYRCEKVRHPSRQGLEDDALLILKKLVELSAKTIVDKYRNNEYREKLKRNVSFLSANEIETLRYYVKLGIQLAGLNLTPLVPFLQEDLLIKYLGSALKMSALIAISVKKYWAIRVVRKFSVSVEEMARSVAKMLEKVNIEKGIGIINNIIINTTSPEMLARLTEKLYRETVYTNTPEVLALAVDLQELRTKFLGTK